MHPALIWFKRDLRVSDHAAVAAACALAPGERLRGLYIIEPGLWAQPDAAAQHWAFGAECLRELAAQLRALGGELCVRQGDATAVLADLHTTQPFTHLLAHEETGNAYTYARDLAVADWCRQQGVQFQEWPQMGVVRRLRTRDDWHIRWERFMRAAPWPQPDAAPPRTAAAALALPSPADLGLLDTPPPRRQHGGRTAALAVLDEFLTDRCGQYRGGISSPLSAPSACSRLSPYLAWGVLGTREVVQATRQRLGELQATDEPWSQRQQAGLKAFLSRMHWHCHFIQKLEDEPELEWRNLHPGYDGLREGEHNPAHFDALTQGRTGWPMVDACVAMLRDTGWINFRMRAMLVSVAAYPLWLHWRPVGLWLAQQFLDYEPGIHWSQLQMQSGTTGINTTRVYNPIKQARDHDPKGHFVRRWLPHMRRVPTEWLFEPWRMPPEVQAACGLTVGVDIPLPLVNLDDALRTAKTRLHGRRAQPEVRADVQAVVRKHGSRTFRDGRPRRGKATTKPAATAQLSLDF